MNDKIIKLINACHSDIDFNIANNCYYITINDFIGFDEEWVKFLEIMTTLRQLIIY